MNELQLSGQNLYRVVNSSSGCIHAVGICWFEAKQPNLKLKTQANNFMVPTRKLLCSWMPGMVNEAKTQKDRRSCGRFVEQKFVLSYRFRFDLIHFCHRYHFGHTLLCYLSQTYMFNKPDPETHPSITIASLGC